MGQSKSIFLEQDDNLENDEIAQTNIQGQETDNNQHEPVLVKKNKNDEIISSITILPTDTNNNDNDKTEGEDIQNIKMNPSMVTKKSDDDDMNHDHKDEEEIKCDIDISNYAVNNDHVHIKITEFSDSMEVNDDHSANKLLDIFDKMDVSTQDINLWQIGSKQGARSGMKTVIDYAETNDKASPDIKTKLRIITKLLMECENNKKQLNEYKNILLLLGSHGNVCHVLKEVAINNGYGMMTNNLNQYIKSQSLQQQILKVLYNYRILLVEKLHHAFKFSNNVHYIASFHNELAKQIGVEEYNDHQYQNTFKNDSTEYPNWRKNLDKRYFKELYTVQNIMQHIMTQIDEKKIGYQKIVNFFEKHCPQNMEKNDFLQKVIDIDNGKIDEKYMYWLLKEVDVFLVKTDEWKEIDKCWEHHDIVIKW